MGTGLGSIPTREGERSLGSIGSIWDPQELCDLKKVSLSIPQFPPLKQEGCVITSMEDMAE